MKLNDMITDALGIGLHPGDAKRLVQAFNANHEGVSE